MLVNLFSFSRSAQTASMAQLDVRPIAHFQALEVTTHPEVEGLSLIGSDNFLSWRLIVKFFTVNLSLPLILKGQLPVSGERLYTNTG